MKAKALFVALLFFPVIASFAGKMREVRTITLYRDKDEAVTIRGEMARSGAEQQQGFMERKNIPDGTGMLFVFSQDQILHFWMKNTPHPLSIAYIDRKGIIRDIFDMKPYSLSTVSSTVSVRYALEVPQGWFSRAGIKPGDRLQLDF